MARLDDGYADADEELAAPGVSTADLTRRAETTARNAVHVYELDEDELEEAKRHDRMVHGETYREKYGRRRGDPKPKRCIHFCLNPGSREQKRCSTCYGRQDTRPMAELPGDIEVPIGRHARFWRWVGWVLGQVWLGITYPLRLDQARMRGLLEDLLPDLVEETVRDTIMAVEMTCTTCAAAELTKEAASAWLEAAES